jgi:hypothetical protein
MDSAGRVYPIPISQSLQYLNTSLSHFFSSETLLQTPGPQFRIPKNPITLLSISAKNRFHPVNPWFLRICV